MIDRGGRTYLRWPLPSFDLSLVPTVAEGSSRSSTVVVVVLNHSANFTASTGQPVRVITCYSVNSFLAHTTACLVATFPIPSQFLGGQPSNFECRCKDALDEHSICSV